MRSDTAFTASESVLHRAYLLWGLLFFTAFYLMFFSSALLEQRLLAPGDGYNFYFPAVSMPWVLWEPKILAGYPVFADPQFFSWYPLRWIMTDYNAFVVSAYVIASTLTYGYVFWRTRSFSAAIASGIVYGTGSFMTGHLGHASIIHSAAWLPLVVWSVDAFDRYRSASWFAAGSSAVALCILGGHPQISFYILLLAGFLASAKLWCHRTKGWTYLLNLALFYCLMVALGLALASIYIIPFIELSGMSSRASAWTYADFTSYSLPLRQLPSAFVPYLFGGGDGNKVPYFGAWWGPTEIMVFAGTGTLVAVVLAAVSRKKGDDTIFWIVTVIVALIICTVGENKLGRVLYSIPVLGSFRAQARAAMIFTFAIAVLAGFGINRTVRSRVSDRQIIVAGFIMLAATLAATSWVVSTKWWTHAAAASGADWKSVVPKILFACSMVIATAISLLVLRRARYTAAISALLLAVVAIDLSQFGWLYEWRYGPSKNLTMSLDWERFAKDSMTRGGRTLLLQEPPPGGTPFGPNLNLKHGVASANGYGPLESKAYLDTTGIDNSGFLSEPPSSAMTETLAVSSVLFGDAISTAVRVGDCSRPSRKQSLTVRLPKTIYASEMEVISMLGCSINRKDGEIALSIRMTADTGKVSVPLIVGRDTAEWAYDRADVTPVVQHSKAAIYLPLTGNGMQGNRYIARLPIPSNKRIPVNMVTVELPAGNEGVVELSRLQLIDASTGIRHNINLAELALNRQDITTSQIEGYNVIHFGEGRVESAWLVGKTLQLSSDEAAQSVRTGQLPDGSSFDPRSLALVEQSTGMLSGTENGPLSPVKRIEQTPVRQVFEVSTSAPALLFVSESYHPGWKARVNGVQTDLLRTNGAFQGIIVPAGQSVVELNFRPLSLAIGGAVTASAAIFLGVLFPLERARRRRPLNARRAPSPEPSLARD
ncbi:YfhO family protein [Aminobacter sp. AP02]|uniref:YfhO family protein n=1 Tax=Aminobacter sp. AP02 TaxID=2135737 RepID=UPI000D6BD02D|nr:YfhO family protein [Aminobacter sp. AP02]PWK72879.1 membrane protein YfhO [Aminobacter sp. AP02]